MSRPTKNGAGHPAPVTLTDEQIVERIVRAAVRETPGPYRMRLAMAEWRKIQAEQQEVEIAAMARHYGED